MAEWSIKKDGLVLRDVEIVSTSKSNGFCFDLDSPVRVRGLGDSKERLRSLFDQVLLAFLTEVSGKRCARPVPAVLGDGRSVDLFKLFLEVRKRGGFDSVSENGLWSLVIEECGLDVGVMASIKLIYKKYLDEFDKWLIGMIGGNSLDNGENGVLKKLDMLSVELDTKFRAILHNKKNSKSKLKKPVVFKSKRNGEYIDLDGDEVHENGGSTLNHDDDKKICETNYEDDIILLSDTSTDSGELDTRKRKRERLPLWRLLNWAVMVARNSDNPAIGKIPDCSQWKEHGNKELWVQALLAREALLVRKHDDSVVVDSPSQKKLKMHPSMYDDTNVLNQQSTEGLRCSKRLPSSPKRTTLCPCCNTCSVNQTKKASPSKLKVENIPKKEDPVAVETLPTNSGNDSPVDELPHKQVAVGPLFQAEVPEWTGLVSESDSKWLGTRIWPPQKGKNDSIVEMDLTGKGRQRPCGCWVKGSVDCVRFHIAEKRMKLKTELGSAFYMWRFHRMGEEISLSWTINEEKKFKDMLSSSSLAPNKSFLDGGFKFFPTRKRVDLVSYYFNVYFIRRRSYQNRVTPKNVDSDDEETELGRVGGRFGLKKVEIPCAEPLMCVENKQCTEFD